MRENADSFDPVEAQEAAFLEQFKQMPRREVSIPPIILVSNKSEDGYEGDIMSDIWKIDTQPKHTIEEPIFISAEHTDGMTDLYAAIEQHLPEGIADKYKEIRNKRVERYYQFREKMIEELIAQEQEEMEEDGEFDLEIDAKEMR